MATSNASSEIDSSASSSDTQAPSTKRQNTFYDRDWKQLTASGLFSSILFSLICRSVFTQLKIHTIKRHFESKHKSYVTLPPRLKSSKYERLLAAYESERGTIQKPTDVSKKQVLTSYKLAYIVCKNKHPFSAAVDFMEFARLADPESEIFSGACASRRTITQQIEEMADYILQKELISSLERSPFFVSYSMIPWTSQHMSNVF